MPMHWAKKYTKEERENSDEYYTPMELVEEHFELTKNILGSLVKQSLRRHSEMIIHIPSFW